MTSLISPYLLERMTTILRSYPSDHPTFDPRNDLSSEDTHLLDAGLQRFGSIIKVAKECNMGVWLDAEQYHRQLGMNFISRELQKNRNEKHEKGDKIWVYNTYQMYLKEASDWIKFDSDYAEKNEFSFGVKLVRGAYLVEERIRAYEHGLPTPCWDSKVSSLTEQKVTV